jgi:hypothetical protein
MLVLINPFLFIKNKQLFLSSEGFSVLQKRQDMFSEGYAAQFSAHPVRCDSPLQVVMVVWRIFFLNLNFGVSQVLKKVLQTAIIICSGLSHCLTRPDHSADKFAEGRSALRAVMTI